MLTIAKERTTRAAKRNCAAVVVYLRSSSMHQGQPGTKFTTVSRPEINLDWRCGP